ncbi:MAG: sigma-70 family RNA polymerase sigma factor [Gammaproteobacteria bacterium]|nr:sigma-70 family RNA polymerase sigma factor [Gammaproteobacteria bacterium]
MVYSTAARLTGNDAQAEDIAQEVFLRAHRRFDELRDNPRAAGWLKTVATNLTFTHLTRYRKRWVFFSQLQGGEESDDGPALDFASEELVEENVRADERHEYVEAALRELPEHQRVPLVLFHFEELAYEQIAQKLRVSLPKVKTDIHRARQALATILARRGITAQQLEA